MLCKKNLPRHVPIVCPLPSKYSRKVFRTTGAVHFVWVPAILTVEFEKFRCPNIEVVVVRVLHKVNRVVSVL
jgi:hypothetical protein